MPGPRPNLLPSAVKQVKKFNDNNLPEIIILLPAHFHLFGCISQKKQQVPTKSTAT